MSLAIILTLFFIALIKTIPLNAQGKNSGLQQTLHKPTKLNLASYGNFNSQKEDNYDFLFASKSKFQGDLCKNCMKAKYLKHYERLGCKEQRTPECQDCIKGYDCTEAQKQVKAPPKVNRIYPGNRINSTDHFKDQCLVDGRYYTVGQRVDIRNQPCKVCSCIKRYDEPTTKVHCSRMMIECPEMAFGVPPEDGCYFSYEDNKCCGRQVCPKEYPPNDVHHHKCEYNLKTYHYGQVIYPTEVDNCLKCMCDKSWNNDDPAKSGSCKRIECNDLKDAKYNNCTPIYSKNSCCPVDFICPKEKKASDEREVEFDNPKETTKALGGGQMPEVEKEDLNDSETKECQLNDRTIPLDGRLFVAREKVARQRTCATCRCFMPPLPTCIVNYECIPPKKVDKY